MVYWDVLVKDKNGHKVSSDEYKAMSKEEKKGMDVIPFFKAFPVYNIDQTNLAEVQPERVQKLLEKFKVPELRDKEGMYVPVSYTHLDVYKRQVHICVSTALRDVPMKFFIFNSCLMFLKNISIIHLAL